MVRELIPFLVSSGHIRRSALGVRVDFISPNDIRRLQLGTISGTIVRAIQPQSGAQKAGFQVDDVIVEFQAQPITGPERLRWLASMAGVNERVTVKIQRHHQIVELTASLGELPASNSPFIDDSEDPDE